MGPKVYEPELIFIGDTPKLQLVLRDGVRSAGQPDGDPVDISAPSKSLTLTIDDPRRNGTDFSIVGDKIDPANGLVEFPISDLETLEWKEGTRNWQVVYQDLGLAVPTKVVVAYGSFHIRKRPVLR